MLIGFGCSVPAIMATRTVSSDRDRKMTILLTPFMSCSAKIPIYAAFSPQRSSPTIQALVMICPVCAGHRGGHSGGAGDEEHRLPGQARALRHGAAQLPAARPLKSVGLLLWEKAKDFLQRAFTVIFLATIVIWFLQSFDTRLNVVTDSADSLLALIGQWLAPCCSSRWASAIGGVPRR